MKKVIIITGSSRGIGAATALKAASQGYAVCVNYLNNESAAHNIVHQIESNNGEAIAVKANMNQEKDIHYLFEQVDTRLGKITALVNNVGVLEQKMRLDQMDKARLERIFQTNIIGYFLCAKEAVKRMSTQYGGLGGAIVNISSAASRLGSAGEYVDYAASKGAIDTLTIGLAKEVANEGIRVNCVRPGFIYTDIHTSGGEPNRIDRIKPNLPLKRGGHPEEIANAIMWLLSDEATYITGTFIDAAGGL